MAPTFLSWSSSLSPWWWLWLLRWSKNVFSQHPFPAIGCERRSALSRSKSSMLVLTKDPLPTRTITGTIWINYIFTQLALRHWSTLHSTRHSSSSSAPTQNSAKRSTLGFAYRFLYSCSAFRTFRKVHLSRLDDSIDHYRITWSYGSRNPWSEFASGLLNIILLLILL